LLNQATAPNLLWAILSVALCVRLYKGSLVLAGSRRRKLAAIALASLSLFPVISASDDLIRYAFLDSFVQTSNGAGAPATGDTGQSHANQLARVLDALDAAQISPVFSLGATAVSFGAAAEFVPIWHVTPATAHSGRAPPVA
jgi:hypothetical protein